MVKPRAAPGSAIAPVTSSVPPVAVTCAPWNAVTAAASLPRPLIPPVELRVTPFVTVTIVAAPLKASVSVPLIVIVLTVVLALSAGEFAVVPIDAAHIMATGGTLEVTGNITDGAGALALAVTGASDELKLDGLCAANTVTFGSSGTLSAGGLTVAAMAIGAGRLVNPGGVITVANGVTVSKGSISGAGRLAASVTASGAATIGAGYGVSTMGLEVTGPIIDSGNALMLVTSNNISLQLDASSSAHAVQTNSNLVLNTGVTLTVGTKLEMFSLGTVALLGPG